MSEENRTPGKPKGVLGDLVKAESFIQLAFALPIGCLVGWLLGHWVDTKVGTHWVGIVGILVGAVGGFIQIYTIAARYMKRDN
jgi:F0F1-type ATP synthase assembly protein I